MGARVLSIFRFLFNRGRVEHEINAELRFHVERETEENIRRGMTPENARLTALRALGGAEKMKEECRDARSGRSLEILWQDIRYGARSLWHNPGFALVAIVTLGLGIGVNTAIFSVVYGVLLRPLPYAHGGQLVVLHQQATKAHLLSVPFSAKEVFDYRDQSHTLDSVVEHHTMTFLLLGPDSAERVQTGVVSTNFFEVLGVRPILGRTFVAGDESANSAAVLILSNKYWRSRHGADTNIVGKVFQMNNRPHTVVGVLPEIPQYPVESDVYMPTSQCPTRSSKGFIANRQARMMTAFGRLKEGVPLARAQADLSTVAAHLESAYPEAYPKGYGYGIAAAALQDDLTRGARTTFLVLLGASGFVLLIACANVANLQLARLLKLQRELAVRTALGATRGRLVRQLLTESLLLSATGGLLALALVPPTVTLLARFAERFTTRAAEIRVDTPVLLFAMLLSLLTGFLFGLAPAFSVGGNVNEALKQGGGRTSSGGDRQRLRSGLVIAQVAVSFMLLIGAGLMIRSFLRLQQVNPGFRTDRLLTLRMTANFSHYKLAQQFADLNTRVLARMRAQPGVESASLTANVPFSAQGIANGPGDTLFQIEGKPISKGEIAPLVDVSVVSSGYFDTIRQPVLQGRAFTDRDDANALNVAVVNQTMARHRWRTEDPVGKRVSLDGGATWIAIQGVVGDAREYGPGRIVHDELYLPALQGLRFGFANNLVVRTASDPANFSQLIRVALHQIDPQLAVDQVITIERLQQDSVASPKVTAVLLGIFAALAMAISATGIAGVMSLAVAQRTHELGIRMALGAPRGGVLRMIVGQGLTLAAIGTGVGIAGAMALTRLLSSLLYDTSPTDVLTFVAVSCVFLTVAAVSCFVPARQVTAIDPLTALRVE
jgi:putative ABC transport system permease protein